MPHALIVVEDADARTHLMEAARAHAFSVDVASSAEGGLTRMETRFPDLLLLDRGFQGQCTIELLDRIRTAGMGSAILVGLNGAGLLEGDPHENGAASLGDPYEAGHLQGILDGVANAVIASKQAEAQRALLQDPGLGHLDGSSPQMLKLYKLLNRLAPSKASVFVCGESGSGKERVARTIHDLSPRKRGSFVAVNCGAIAAGLMESEIFGHEKGSFSGAARRHRGLFEQAHGGTLLLDEITEMPLELQVKLLRVLETGEVMRVGAEAATDVDVRIVATTNRPPKKAVTDGKLREDLYYRLRTVEVEVPPLRNRPDDIPRLAEIILDEIGETEGQKKAIGPEVTEILQDYEWPGNVRELRNCLYSTYLLSDGPELEADSVPSEVRRGAYSA